MIVGQRTERRVRGSVERLHEAITAAQSNVLAAEGHRDYTGLVCDRADHTQVGRPLERRSLALSSARWIGTNRNEKRLVGREA